MAVQLCLTPFFLAAWWLYLRLVAQTLIVRRSRVHQLAIAPAGITLYFVAAARSATRLVDDQVCFVKMEE